MRQNLLLVAACTLSLVGCQEDEPDQLPDSTRSGADTAGALINGKAFRASIVYMGMAPLPAVVGGYAYDRQVHLRFYGQLDEQIVGITLFVEDATAPGTYLFNRYTRRLPDALPDQVKSYGEFLFNKTGNFYGTDDTPTGHVTITQGERGARNGIADIFAFEAAFGTNVLHIMEGRFDLATPR